MISTKIFNYIIKSNYKHLLIRNLSYKACFGGPLYKNANIKDFSAHNCNIKPKLNQIRYNSTSSAENPDTSGSFPINSEPSDGVKWPENLLGTEEFLKLLKWTWDKNSNLMRLIQKCKDDLIGLSSSSYPFKKHDVRVLIELLSGVLSLQSNKNDMDLLCKLLDSQKVNNKLTFGLDFCKLFSSSYESISKLESPLLTKVFNKAMIALTKYFIPNVMVSSNENNLNGVKFAFNALSESINSQNFEVLEQCCNDKLYKYIKNGIDFLSSLKLKINLNVMSIDELVIDKFYLTIGGVRNDGFSGTFLSKAPAINPVIISKLPPPKNADEYRNMVVKCFEKGAIMRMEVILNTTQSLTLVDENNEVKWTDFKPLCTHRLCFESEFKLHSQLKSGKKIDFQTGDWILVDINGILNNNNPLKN